MNKFLKKIVWLIIIAPVVYLAFVWNKIPDKIATHFDLKGIPDKYGSKTQLWIGIGAIALVGALIYILMTHLNRGKHAVENKDRFLRIGFTIAVFMSVISITLVLSSANEGGIRFNIRFIFATMGFLWAIMGNYMHNIKPNYFAGFRLSWTLKNEENWRKTHLVGGKLWFAGGLMIGIIWLFSPITIGLIVTFTLILIMLIVPFVYSYRLYKKQKALNSTNK